MSPLALPLSIDDLELAYFKEQYAEGYGKQTGKVILRRNLVKQSLIAANTGASNSFHWTAGGQANSTFADGAGSFAGSLQVTSNAAGAFACVANNSGVTVAAEPSITYTFSVDAYVPTGSPDIKTQLFLTGVTSTSGATISTKDTWVRLFCTITLPASLAGAAGTLGVGLVATATAAGQLFYCKNPLLEKSSTVQTFFNGDTTDLNGITYEWEGAVDASTSIKWSTEPILLENLNRNGDFEYGNNKWGGEANVTAQLVNDSFRGKQAVKVTKNVATTNQVGLVTTDIQNLIIGEVYSTRAKVKALSNIQMGWSNGNVASPKVDLVANGQWVNVDFPAWTCTSVTQLNALLFTTAGSIGDAYIVDSITIVKGSKCVDLPHEAPVWSSYVGDSFQIYYDTNARNIDFLEREYYAKGSGLTPKEQYTVADHMLAFLRNNFKAVTGGPTTVVRKNLITNPNFESDLSSWAGQAGSTIALSTADKYSGTQSMLVTQTAASGNVSAQYHFTDLVVGKTYTASAYVKRQAGVNGAGIHVGSNDIIDSSTAYVSDTSAWVRISIKFAPRTSDVFVYVHNATAFMAVGSLNDATYVDAVLVEQSDVLGSYFDGISGNNYRWTGTPNASASEQVDPSKHGITDLLMSYRMQRSGLTPANKFSMADHEVAMYKSALGL